MAIGRGGWDCSNPYAETGPCNWTDTDSDPGMVTGNGVGFEAGGHIEVGFGISDLHSWSWNLVLVSQLVTVGVKNSHKVNCLVIDKVMVSGNFPGKKILESGLWIGPVGVHDHRRIFPTFQFFHLGT